MNDHHKPGKSDRSLLRAVVAIIVLGLGALAWEWHNAHNTPARPAPVSTRLSDP
jgi:hypothetical protein